MRLHIRIDCSKFDCICFPDSAATWAQSEAYRGTGFDIPASVGDGCAMKLPATDTVAYGSIPRILVVSLNRATVAPCRRRINRRCSYCVSCRGGFVRSSVLGSCGECHGMISRGMQRGMIRGSRDDLGDRRFKDVGGTQVVEFWDQHIDLATRYHCLHCVTGTAEQFVNGGGFHGRKHFNHSVEC